MQSEATKLLQERRRKGKKYSTHNKKNMDTIEQDYRSLDDDYMNDQAPIRSMFQPASSTSQIRPDVTSSDPSMATLWADGGSNEEQILAMTFGGSILPVITSDEIIEYSSNDNKSNTDNCCLRNRCLITVAIAFVISLLLLVFVELKFRIF